VAGGAGRKNPDPTRTRFWRAIERRAIEYEIDETLEAGLALVGSEVKSIRDGKVTLIDAYASVESGEAWLHQLDHPASIHLPTRGNHDPRRRRKLLACTGKRSSPGGESTEKGYTPDPLSLYESAVPGEGGNWRWVAWQAAIRPGARTSKKREAQREMDRAMSRRRS